jgi:hypothetical protein
MTTSLACPINVTWGASYVLCIRFTSLLFLVKNLFIDRFLTLSVRTSAQPQFQCDDLPQLGLVAIESRGKPVQPRKQARAIHKSALNEMQFLRAGEDTDERNEGFVPWKVENPFGPPHPELGWPQIQ